MTAAPMLPRAGPVVVLLLRRTRGTPRDSAQAGWR